MLKLIVLAGLIGFCAAAAKLEEVFAWKEVSFAWPDEETLNAAVKNGDYIRENNLPLGLDRWKNKLFVTVPRWKAGVPSSLNYIPLPPPNKTAPLIPYPDWKANTLPKTGEEPEENTITSTFRIKVDACDRLWVMDTGVSDILGEFRVIASPSILIFDLNTDKLIRRYTLKESDLKGQDSFFANTIVDVIPGKCDDAYAYLPDFGGNGIVVYSYLKNDSWRVKHNFFHFDPLKGDLTVGGVNFQWNDGVFGVALGPADKNGDRTVYFHAIASTNEFSVNSRVLKNETLATDSNNYDLFKVEGNRGENSQSSSSVFDEPCNVLFYTQITRDGVACWNPRRPLVPENTALVAQDHEKLVFNNDIKIDQERNLWIVSDRLPIFIFSKLNPDDINYRIFKVPVDEAIRGTVCVA